MTANRAMFSIATMSRALGVSRAGYYAWLERGPSARSQADAELTDRTGAIHKASRETYGGRASMPSSSMRASVSAASGSSG